jgi:endogenous inhibitor of DNA gyrase (YacG/DUF329 family)
MKSDDNDHPRRVGPFALTMEREVAIEGLSRWWWWRVHDGQGNVVEAGRCLNEKIATLCGETSRRRWSEACPPPIAYSCVECGKPMDRTGDLYGGRAKRADARFCSSRCRMRDYRRRKSAGTRNGSATGNGGGEE